MKLLVVFENRAELAQNLGAALRSARLIQSAKPELKSGLMVRVCVLALLAEDRALDEYLVKMERDSQQALEVARRIIVEENMLSATLEVVRGMEPEAAQLIAKRANEWEADQIFVSQPRECGECYKARLAAAGGRRKLSFFGLNSESKMERENLPLGVREFNPMVRAEDLLNLSGCRIVMTCHGEITMAVQKYLPKNGRGGERIVYEHVSSRAS